MAGPLLRRRETDTTSCRYSTWLEKSDHCTDGEWLEKGSWRVQSWTALLSHICVERHDADVGHPGFVVQINGKNNGNSAAWAADLEVCVWRLLRCGSGE